jgi:hypothetical protein
MDPHHQLADSVDKTRRQIRRERVADVAVTTGAVVVGVVLMAAVLAMLIGGG